MISLTRRQFVAAATVATGYALAVRPVAASSIHTDATGLEASMVSIQAADRQIPAYMAKPEGKGPFPVILVVHEIFDLHEYIQDICRRFAKQGYLAIAPSLFARAGDVSQMTDIPKIISDVVAKTPDGQVMSDLDATSAYAMQNGGDPDKLGITGFCWGGRVVWLYSMHNKALKAGVAWYGMVGANPFGGPPVLDTVAQVNAPVLGLYGGQDNSIPLDTLEQMRTALKANDKPGEIVVYPDAGHAFFADYRPSYNADAAALAWPRCLDWFSKYLS